MVHGVGRQFRAAMMSQSGTTKRTKLTTSPITRNTKKKQPRKPRPWRAFFAASEPDPVTLMKEASSMKHQASRSMVPSGSILHENQRKGGGHGRRESPGLDRGQGARRHPGRRRRADVRPPYPD